MEKDQIVFTKQELVEFFPEGDEQLLCFGLLQSVETVLDVTCVVSFNFLHLTFMEYLAALHLSRQSQDRILEIVKTNRFAIVVRFIFGIKFCRSCESNVSLTFVKQAVQYVTDSDRLSVCHCALEAQNDLVTGEVLQCLMSKPYILDGVEFGCPGNPHDCAAILYVITKLNMQKCCELNIIFNNCGVRKNQIITLTYALASKRGKLQVNELDLSGNKLTDKAMSYLFDRASAAFQSLTLLDLSDNNIGGETVKLVHCPHLKRLDLSDINLGYPGAAALASVISHLQHHKTKDGKLRLPLTDVLLNQTNLGDKGLCTFVDSLDGECHFEILSLNDSDIHVTGVSCLADAVCKGKIVLRGRLAILNLRNNILGLEGALAVGRMLSSNHCQLHIFDLCGCKLTTAGGSPLHTDPLNLGNNICTVAVRDVGHQLCQMPQNNTIINLCLDGSSFTGNNINLLVAFMYLCPCLKGLNTSNCEISSDDLIQLLHTLSSLKSSSPSLCSELNSWLLDNNAISDSGVSALIEHLPSLFPKLGFDGLGIVHLHNNPAISIDMKKTLEKELRRRREVRF